MLNRIVAIEQVKHFLNDLKNSGLEFNKAILFGSSAREEMHEWSDIDLMLVSDQFTNNIFENIKLYS